MRRSGMQFRWFHHRRCPYVLYSQSTSDFRRMIYNRQLRVSPMTGGRIRAISSYFFKENPACVHRLVPWLNRELNVLLDGHASRVQFLIRLICRLVQRYEITSSMFRKRIFSYLQIYTDHFIHEFYNFTRSPYDMQDYDRVAHYDGIGGSETDLRFAADRASPDVTILGPVHSQLPDLTELGIIIYFVHLLVNCSGLGSSDVMNT
ncbi:unnamed protein product [Soboliphyme baturini]|uniref:RING-type E3 ubiquitin transferase n=1 Tax=Soboliphyme baturini TaxID=241478 RepID=A0A183IAQ8_9BILA|nr:unnamed protein product [Soboliphyme baturini]